ncbi:MAG: GNAT family N-acetyltransferase [Chloroflexi bacterium]|nr:GNAT family N-acetyltransferase [Chloroflexota bacterium]
MMKIEIIRAIPEESENLKQIAVLSKSHWGYPEALISKWAQTAIITPQAIEEDRVFKACADGVVIGWYRLTPRLPVNELEDLWVLPEYIGKGVGRTLFEHAVIQAKSTGAGQLELAADPNAEPFYTHMGCRKIGEVISEWGRAIPHLMLEL